MRKLIWALWEQRSRAKGFGRMVACFGARCCMYCIPQRCIALTRGVEQVLANNREATNKILYSWNEVTCLSDLLKADALVKT